MASRFTRPIATLFLYASLPVVSLNYIRTRLLIEEEKEAAMSDIERLEGLVKEKAQSLNLLQPSSLLISEETKQQVLSNAQTSAMPSFTDMAK